MAQRLNIDIVARDKASQALNGLRGGLSKVRSAVFNLQNAFLGLGAGLVVRNLVNTGRELENLQVRLKFLLKDTNEGAKAFDNMVKFASKVPFSLEEIQAGSGILATVTDNAKDLQQMLEITGNVAAVTGLDFRTTAEQIQRSFSAGIGAADLFREKGVRNMLGFQAGANVSITQTAEAFERVFGKGGRFGKATDDLAQTFTGTLSMIGDKFFNFKKVLLEAGFFEQLKKQFGDLDKSLEENGETLDKIAVTIGTVLATAVEKIGNGFRILANNADKVMFAFKAIVAVGIVKMFINLARAIVPIVAGLRAIVSLSGVGIPLVEASVAATVATFKVLGKEIDKIAESIDNNFHRMKNNVKDFEHEMSIDTDGGFKNSMIIAREFEHEMSIAIPSATQKAIEKFKELNDGALENMKKKMSNIKMIISEGISNGITKVSEGIARSVILGEKLGDAFKKIAQDAVIRILSGLIEMGLRIAANIVLEKISEAIARRKNREQNNLNKGLKSEVALRAMIAAFGGGGGGGFSLPFFNKGGAVAKGKPVVVGESGAELFIPNQTGQITQSARGTGTGNVNVNFTINAVDASGIDRLLVERRGTISRIINESVNERGSSNLI